MAFKIRRGTNAERLTITPAEGELIYTTDTKKLYVGDGATTGGTAVTDLSAYATQAYVDQAVSDIIDGAIPALDTLKELADAIGGDSDFITTINNQLADKANSADLATVATSGSYNDLSNKPSIPSIAGLATETYVDNAISDLVNGADGALDTLKELGDELTNNASAVSALTTAISNKITNADTSALTPGDMFFTQTGDTVSMGSLAAQNITAGPSGIQIAGTGGVTIMGVATAGVTLGGGTSGAIDFASSTTGIDYNDLDNKPSIPDLGAVAQDIIPDTDVTYDLGSPTNRFKDLYLSNNTLYLGNDAISVDGVYGLSLKQPGGGEGYGAGSVEWTDQSTLVFSGVEVAHPLYGYLEKLTKGDKIKELAPGDADFTITVTGSLQFGPNVGGFVDVTVPVDQPKSQNNVGSNYYVYVVEFIKPVNNFNNLENSPLVENSSGWYDIDPNANKSIGLQNIVGDGTIYVRPSWDRTPTVDFQFKENGTIQLPAGGDIVDSAGVSVLGGGGGSGLQGIQGIQGIQGGEGSPGLQGLPGIDGSPGNDGLQGLQGLQGADGLQGPAGTPGGNANTGDITFTGDNIGSTTDIVTIEVDGGEGAREFTFGSDGRSLRAQISMPQGAKLNFGADATALGGPDSAGSTDKIRLWDFQGSNPSGYNYAIGAEGGGIWFSTDVNNGTGGFSFYSQNNRKFKIRDDGTVDLYNHILPDGNDIIDLGSENTKFRNVYAAGVTNSHQRATSCPVNADTVVYTATGQYQHAIKLFAMVEGNVDGEGASWHTQACDIIAVRGYNNNTVFVTTYGVNYTSNAAIATFDGQWNATTNRIEITCRPVSTTDSVVVSVHAIEMTSQD